MVNPITIIIRRVNNLTRLQTPDGSLIISAGAMRDNLVHTLEFERDKEYANDMLVLYFENSRIVLGKSNTYAIPNSITMLGAANIQVAFMRGDVEIEHSINTVTLFFMESIGSSDASVPESIPDITLELANQAFTGVHVDYDDASMIFTNLQGDERASIPFIGGGEAPGIPGAPGLSAYEIAVQHGFEGTEEEWLISLIGQDGIDGKDGRNIELRKSDTHIQWRLESDEWNNLISLSDISGQDGADGLNGLSAYEIAVGNGFIGSESEWLDSLIGADGRDGEDGISPHIGENGNWWVGDIDTGVQARGEDGESFDPADLNRINDTLSDHDDRLITNADAIYALQEEATAKWVLLNTVDNLSRDNETRVSNIEASDRWIPTGGNTNQILAKASGADFDTHWVDQAAGGGGGAELSFVYKCTGTADSTAIANIVNNFFANGTAMSMKLVITGTMGVAYTTVSGNQTAIGITSNNDRGAFCNLDFTDCNISTITYSSRRFLYITNSAVRIRINGLVLSATGSSVVGIDVTSGTTYLNISDCIISTTDNAIQLGAVINATINRCILTSSSQSAIFMISGSNNIFNDCIIKTTATGRYAVQHTFGSSNHGVNTFINCTLIGIHSGLYTDATPTSIMFRLECCRIMGTTYSINQTSGASTVSWYIMGCELNGAVKVNNVTISAATTATATAFVYMPAYANQFGRTIS